MTTAAPPVNGFNFPSTGHPTTGPFPGTVTVQPVIWKPTQRPSFTVVIQRAGASYTINYDANHIAYAMHDGKYVVTFISSGTLTIVPVSEVVRIDFHPISAHYCGQCDQGLVAWPHNDPAYAGSNPATVTFLGTAGTASGESTL